MTDSPKCYSYIRFSRAEQSKGSSFNRQREYAIEYANNHNLTLDTDLSLNDPGISAFRGKNIEKGALGAFLALVKSGRIPRNSVLIIEALDRLTRQKILSALNIFTDIIENDITIVTATDEMTYSKESINQNPQDLIASITLLHLAHRESLQKADRLSKSWIKKRQQIDTTKLTGLCPAWLELTPDKKSFDVIPERKSLIHRIFSMSYAGVGAKSIAKQFNMEGISEWVTKKRTTKGWQGSYIYKIINTRAVLGEFQGSSLFQVGSLKSSLPAMR